MKNDQNYDESSQKKKIIFNYIYVFRKLAKAM